MNLRKSSFPPVVGDNCRVLILGSLPGEKSLAQQQYYAHPRNLFWHLIGQVIDVELVGLPYPARLNTLRENGVGLWDVVASAQREGSLDAQLRNPTANPIAALCQTLPHLRAVAFNGATAFKLGSALVPAEVPTVKLLSSSPANAGYSADQKSKQWTILREFLHPILSPQGEGPIAES
ncbi:MAG: DNA-deoxyinosine glycosylase [Erythrobacter sp.]|nr:MAG: DNA-deoxyinosine glycosylase [Erythrobacter sp.]